VAKWNTSEPAKRLNEAIGRRAGRSIQGYPPIGTLAREMKRFIEKLEIRHVVDVGAHIGGFGTRLRRSGFDGDIASFEPNPAAFEQLSHLISTDPRWSATQLALGASDDTLIFRTYGGSGQFDSMLPLADHAEVFSPGLSEIDTTPIRVCRLDSVWPASLPPGRTLLKIDTQGFDLEVLKGTEVLLGQISLAERPVLGLPRGDLPDGRPRRHPALRVPVPDGQEALADRQAQ